MTDAKELAARLRERSEYYDIRAMSGVSVDADYSEATAIDLSEAAAALEARADENERLAERLRARAMISADADDLVRSAQLHADKLQARIHALEQAAAPFVRMAKAFDDLEPPRILWDEGSLSAVILVGDGVRETITLGENDFRALARATGGGNEV